MSQILLDIDFGLECQINQAMRPSHSKPADFILEAVNWYLYELSLRSLKQQEQSDNEKR